MRRNGSDITRLKDDQEWLFPPWSVTNRFQRPVIPQASISEDARWPFLNRKMLSSPTICASDTELLLCEGDTWTLFLWKLPANYPAVSPSCTHVALFSPGRMNGCEPPKASEILSVAKSWKWLLNGYWGWGGELQGRGSQMFTFQDNSENALGDGHAVGQGTASTSSSWLSKEP